MWFAGIREEGGQLPVPRGREGKPGLSWTTRETFVLVFVQPHPKGRREILPQNKIATIIFFQDFKAFSCDVKDRGWKSLREKSVIKPCVMDERCNPQVRQPPSSFSVASLVSDLRCGAGVMRPEDAPGGRWTPVVHPPSLDAELEVYGGTMGCSECCRVRNRGTCRALLAAGSRGS